MIRRGTLPDTVLIHSAPHAEAMLFRDELHATARRHPTFELHERFTRRDGRLSADDDLTRVCPDWRERQAWVCGPGAMLAEHAKVWADAGLSDALHLEPFGTAVVGDDAEGGTVHFAASGVTTSADGATTLLHAGERAGVLVPFGCRMGTCHTCVVPLLAGAVRDLRTGVEYRGNHQKIQTCITAAAGDCTVDL
jgi:ferredoxin